MLKPLDYAVGMPHKKNPKYLGKMINNWETLKEAKEAFDRLLPKYKKVSRIFKYTIPKGKSESQGKWLLYK